jgi:hypothetical protein
VRNVRCCYSDNLMLKQNTHTEKRIDMMITSSRELNALSFMNEYIYKTMQECMQNKDTARAPPVHLQKWQMLL